MKKINIFLKTGNIINKLFNQKYSILYVININPYVQIKSTKI